MKKLLALSGLALAASSNVLAVEQPYIGAAFAQPTFSDNLSGDATPSLAQLRFGSDLSKNFGLEARASLSAGDDKLGGGRGYTFSVDSMYTLGAVLRLPFGERASIYGTLGYSYAQVTFSDPTLPAPPPSTNHIEENLDGLTYGVGIVLPAFKGFHLEADFTSYMSGDDTLGGIAVGVRRYL